MDVSCSSAVPPPLWSTLRRGASLQCATIGFLDRPADFRKTIQQTIERRDSPAFFLNKKRERSQNEIRQRCTLYLLPYFHHGDIVRQRTLILKPLDVSWRTLIIPASR